MFEYYQGDMDPQLDEPTCLEDVENHGHVECSNGCGWWRGQLLNHLQCPDCGDECHEPNEDHFDDLPLTCA
ncbi:hypothetical protein ACP3V3_16945 [Vibrio sp. PNB22_3_1]